MADDLNPKEQCLEYLQTARDGFGALLRDFQSMHAKVFVELPQQLASLEQRVQSLQAPQTNAGARQGERVQDVDETSQHRSTMERFGGAVSGKSSKSSQKDDWIKRVERLVTQRPALRPRSVAAALPLAPAPEQVLCRGELEPQLS